MNISVRLTAISILAALLVGCNGDDDSVAPTLPPEFANAVLTGEFSNIEESVGLFLWGDGLNVLCQQWSARRDGTGFVYGSSFSWSSADVYILPNNVSLDEVVAAENFPYETDSVVFVDGDTVMFRGSNGFFGAWVVERVTLEILSGRWYFKAGGGGDFTGTVAEEGSAIYNRNSGRCDR